LIVNNQAKQSSQTIKPNNQAKQSTIKRFDEGSHGGSNESCLISSGLIE